MAKTQFKDDNNQLAASNPLLLPFNAEKVVTFNSGITSGKLATAASATLTSDGTAPANGDTVTIGTTVYTFRTALTTAPATVPYEVLIGASAAAALDNLKLAIDKGATEGTNYSTGTLAHPTHSGGTNTDTTQVVTADATGLAGNVAIATSSAHLTWGAGVTAMTTGSSGTVPLFTVTGTVLVKIIPVCETNLAGATSTFSVGTSALPSTILAATTGTNVVAGDMVLAAATTVDLAVTTVPAFFYVNNDIEAKIETAAMSGGVLRFICNWSPVSADGNVAIA